MKFLLAAALVVLTPAAARAEAPMPPAFAALAAKVMPSVVSVASTDPVSDSSQSGDNNDDNSTPDDPGKATGGLKPSGAADTTSGSVLPPPKAQEALGAGFVIDPAGYIVTNNHVIDGATSVTVTFQDGTILPATVVGTDKGGDLAVLKVDAGRKLPAVRFGDSTKLRVGDWVLAIGNPYGLAGSTSAGIVSALHRNIGEDSFDDFIQTDATINRGNSGGPLFDLSGDVVGVNSAIYSPSGGSVGIGFAIPAAMVQPVAQSLETNGAMTRGWLGIAVQEVTPDIQTLLGLPDTTGALIGGVSPNGPASKALRAGDVLVGLNGVAIADPRGLMVRTAEIPSGQTATAKFYRDGTLQSAAVTLAVAPPDPMPGTATAGNAPNLTIPTIGMTLASDAPAKVVGVTQNSPAAKAGIVIDDIVEAAGAQTISTGTELKNTLQQTPHQTATLLISGDDATGGDPGPRWVALGVGK